MNLAFVHPAFLWGALSAFVPLLIHLINRRRSRQVEFAAIAFVLKSQARHARKLQLKRLILLLLRMAVCVGVPLALARPFLAAPAAAGTPTQEARAVVVLLDTSFSMRYRLDGKTLFARAREQAGELLDSLGPTDAVLLLPCADGHAAPTEGPSYDLSRAREVLREAKVGYRASKLEACLGVATSLLEGSLLASLEIVVLTDLTAAAWSLDAPVPTVVRGGVPERPVIRVIDVAKGSLLPNHWIASVVAEPAYALGPRGYAFDVSLRSSGGAEAKGLPVALRVGEKARTQGFVDLGANSSAHKVLAHHFERGGDRSGEIRVEEDALPEDDRVPFLQKVRQDVRALLVDGDPSTNRFADEIYFVERALAPGRGESSAIFPTVIDVDGFSPERLQGIDLLLLLNVGTLSAEAGAAIVRFVEGGGGLFVSVGAKTDADETNLRLGSVLPARLHLPRASEGGAVALGAIAWDHPIFSIFEGEGREGFASARFSTYFLTRPLERGARAVMAFEDDAPVLLVRDVGKGRVALYTSTVDRAWTDFPIRTAFLPTLQQVAGYLSHSLEERHDFVETLGAPHRLHLGPGVTAVQVLDPAGEVHEPPILSTGEVGGEVLFSATEQPGHYRVRVRETGAERFEPRPVLDFVVRLDPGESDTTRLDPAELQARFQNAGAASGSGVVFGDGRPKRQPLWSMALLLVVLLVIGEGWLLR